MKTFKKILIGVAIAVTVIFANGIYYVFNGQFKSAEKLAEGKDLNLYECCSIYSMHTAVWMFGWPVSPEAALEAFLMHFPHADITLPLDAYAFNGFSTEIHSYDYAHMSFKDLRHSLALNSPETYWDVTTSYSLCVVPVKYTNNVRQVWKFPVNTVLFKYLQDKRILFPYKMIYYHMYV